MLNYALETVPLGNLWTWIGGHLLYAVALTNYNAHGMFEPLKPVVFEFWLLKVRHFAKSYSNFS